METTHSRLGRVLKDLAFACLNATLLLILMGLLIYFLAARKLEHVADSFARSVAVVTPLREDMAEIRRSLDALHEAMADRGNGAIPQPQIDALAARIETLHSTLEGLAETPARLLDRAIETGAREATATLMALRSCSPPAGAALPAL
jgi:vacuolar-type H+-ATPase subunit I/STV1